MIGSAVFPRLTATNHRVTSPATPSYNCIAWCAGDIDHWWQPGVFWPLPAQPEEFGVQVLQGAFIALGFEECVDARPEPGYEKLALYGSKAFYTHAARQLPFGTWTSKLGRDVDIEHNTPDDLAGGLYGDVVQFMRRRTTVHDTQ